MTQDFQARLAALRAQHGGSVPAQAPTQTAPAAQGPVTHAPVSGETADDGAKRELRNLPLLSIYRNWFRPASERVGGGGEVNLSCFNTDFHSGGDVNPQFGINTVKNTYYCHACQVTGDIIDLTAVYHGFANHDWKCPDNQVHVAVKEAGTELLGMDFRKTPAGWQRVPDFVPSGAVSTTPVAASPASGVPVGVQMTSASALGPMAPAKLPAGHVGAGIFQGGPARPTTTNELPAGIDLPEPTVTGRDEFAGGIELNWREMVPEDTPLFRYLDVVCRDDSPEEYHFWNFMVLIGLILGKDVGLVDAEIVYGNLLVCIVGQTGVGKSRSERHLAKLINSVMPFDDTLDASKGIKIVSGSGSGEYMMREFQHFTPDPRSTAKIKFPDIPHPGIRGLVKWSELSEMVGKSSGTGSTVKEKVMELYDASGDIQYGSLAHGKTVVKNPFGSVITTTQPESIRRLLSRDQVTSGFLNRWIFASGVPKIIHPRGSLIDPTVSKADLLLLREWANSKSVQGRGFQDIEVDAGEVYDEFIVNNLAKLKRSDPIYARVDLLFKKLTLLLSANMLESAVSTSTVNQAIKLFDYVIRCYESFGAAMAHSEISELQEEILERLDQKIKKTGEGVSGYDIVQSFKRKHDSETVRKALRELEELGRIFIASPPRPGPGRKPKLYYLETAK